MKIRSCLLKTAIVLSLVNLASCRGKSPERENESSTQAIDFNDVKNFIKRIGIVLTRNAKDIHRLHENISNAERIQVIKNIPITEIVSAPGHLMLRKPDAVKAMAKAIENANDGGKSFVKGQEPIVLNVFTSKVVDEAGKTNITIRSIEVMDGNHRLAAGVLARYGDNFSKIEAGARAKVNGRRVWQNIGDIPEEVLQVRVNGLLAHGGGKPRRWIPATIFDGLSCSNNPLCRKFREGRNGHFLRIRDDRGGEAIEVSGGLSSLDDVIPDKYKGKTISEVLACSLSRAC